MIWGSVSTTNFQLKNPLPSAWTSASPGSSMETPRSNGYRPEGRKGGLKWGTERARKGWKTMKSPWNNKDWLKYHWWVMVISNIMIHRTSMKMVITRSIELRAWSFIPPMNSSHVISTEDADSAILHLFCVDAKQVELPGIKSAHHWIWQVLLMFATLSCLLWHCETTSLNGRTQSWTLLRNVQRTGECRRSSIIKPFRILSQWKCRMTSVSSVVGNFKQ